MGNFAERVGFFLSNPQRIIQTVATLLLYPVLFGEVFALIWIVYQAGSFTWEAWKRRKARQGLDIEAIALELAAADDPVKVGDALSRFNWGPVLGPAVDALSSQGVTRLRALKILTDTEQSAARLLDRTRVFIRLGPILGLMGTLIPISPALVALAAGDVKTLSTNLIIAFSTTVVGLLIGSIAYMVSLTRERAYTQDMSDLEYVLERAGA
jgi:biopolymer transport protein ExbB/TolQ